MPLPFAHSAAGLTCYFLLPSEQRKILSRHKRMFLPLAAIALANAPDLDFLPGFIVGQPNYFHHGPSHSFVGVFALSGTIYFFIRCYFEKIKKRNFIFFIFGASLSHLALDYFSSDTRIPYGIPLIWPFSAEHFISPLPLFKDVVRSGESNVIFLQTLLNKNNLLELTLEALFAIILFSAFILIKYKMKTWQFAVAFACLIGSIMGYYIFL